METNAITAEAYARAEALQANRLHTVAIYRCNLTPVPISDSNQFWYRVSTEDGPRFIFVDADTDTRDEAFDHAAVAAKLGESLGHEVQANALPIIALDYSQPGKLGLRLPGSLFWWDADSATLNADPHAGIQFSEVASPGGSWAASSEDYNLVLRNLKTGETRQLTTDGSERYAYATHPDGIAWSHELERLGFTMPPPVIW